MQDLESARIDLKPPKIVVSVVFVLVLKMGVAAGQAKAHPSVVGASKAVSTAPLAIAKATAEVLRNLSSRAGVIFVGHVVRVEREDELGYVDISFAVDQGVRGCSSSSTYVLREWIGLWADSQATFGVGSRLLMLLTARGPSGMSAPVGGMAGALPLMGTRPPPLLRGARTVPAFSVSEMTEPEVDLRWVELLAPRSALTSRKLAPRSEDSRADKAVWAGPAASLTEGIGGTGHRTKLRDVLDLVSTVERGD